MARIFVDSGVLLDAVHGIGAKREAALAFLEDPEHTFLTSPFQIVRRLLGGRGVAIQGLAASPDGQTLYPSARLRSRFGADGPRQHHHKLAALQPELRLRAGRLADQADHARDTAAGIGDQADFQEDVVDRRVAEHVNSGAERPPG